MDGYYQGPCYWEAIAMFSDGSELEFTRPFTAKGSRAEDEQQYDIECELLEKAVATGKEVIFYSVNFVREE